MNFSRVFNAIQRRVVFAYLRWHGVEAEFGAVQFKGFPLIKRAPGSTIKIGKNVVLVSSSRFNPAGICHRVVLATLQPNATIEIGEHNGLSGVTICAAQSVKTGSYVMFGANAAVYDTDFHSADHLARRTQRGLDAGIPVKPVVIGDDVWISANVTILKGVHIGDRAIIGAGAVVAGSIPADTVAGGVPARVVKHNAPPEHVETPNLTDTRARNFASFAEAKPSE